MEAKELRIGNWIKCTKNNCLNKKGDFIIDEYEMVKILEHGQQFLEPIPLTYEWLLKFGFEWCNEYDSYKKEAEEKTYYVTLWRSGFIELFIKENNFCSGTIPFKHVHQLQNLYFALTGEELKTK